jgi:dTDP-4-amino-4,6-dideoxygalactose transaminase
MTWKVPFIDLPTQNLRYESELSSAFLRILREGAFILRDDVRIFELAMANYLGVKHVIGVNSGADALSLVVRAAGIAEGDEVLTVSHTYVATLAAIAHARATPILVDICDDFNIDVERLEEKLTDKTRAILPVHLNGRMSDMERISEFAKKNGLIVIEDSAQALGSSFSQRKAGTWGMAGCFSAHPMKTLGCAGDGGYISTNDDELATKLRILRNHGHKTKEEFHCYGVNSRLDNLQAAILNVKLPHLNDFINRRREIAGTYTKLLSEIEDLKLPRAPSNGTYFDTYNSYVVRVPANHRDSFKSHLTGAGIEVFSHMAKALHRQGDLKLTPVNLPMNDLLCQEIVSLPIYPEMGEQDIAYVAQSVKSFFDSP